LVSPISCPAGLIFNGFARKTKKAISHTEAQGSQRKTILMFETLRTLRLCVRISFVNPVDPTVPSEMLLSFYFTGVNPV
jgi:hypothetical protein